MANPITPADLLGLVLCPEHDRDTICFSRQRAEQVNAALLQGAEALERTTWQPISTAPKDGQAVLLASAYGARVCSWTDHGWAFYQQKPGAPTVVMTRPLWWMPILPLPAAPVGRTEETP